VLVTNCPAVQSGLYDGFKTSLLIGESNSGSKEISIQITEVEPQKMQFIHSHDEEQCYYIVCGTGLMFINSEEKNVSNGDAVFIPSNASHGIECRSGEAGVSHCEQGFRPGEGEFDMASCLWQMNYHTISYAVSGGEDNKACLDSLRHRERKKRESSH